MAIFSIGDTVIYGIHGICKITDIQKRDFMGEIADYFILSPIYDERSTVFVPCENENLTSKMKRIMSAEEIYEMIRSMPSEQQVWIDSEHERKKCYAEILKSGDRKLLIGLIKTLYLHKEKQQASGKKLHISDENFLRDAEKILYEEFAHVLQIKREQVLPFICSQIEIQEKNN